MSAAKDFPGLRRFTPNKMKRRFPVPSVLRSPKKPS